MAYRFAVEGHGFCFPSKVLAREGGKHIYNIVATEEVDNGWFVGKGAWAGLERYTEAAPGTATGTVLEKAANGNWYIEIVTAVNAYLVYTVPMVERDEKDFQKDGVFFNATGDVMRCYELAPGDIIEFGEAALDGTAVTAGNTVELKAITGATAKRFGKQ